VDHLSEVLRDLRLESAVFGVLELRAPWGFRDEALQGGAPFYVVIEGSCLFRMGPSTPIELRAGDLVVLPHGDAHVLSSSASAPTVSFTSLIKGKGVTKPVANREQANRPTLIRFGPIKGGLFRVVSGAFAFRDPRRNPILEVLPALIHIAGEHGRGQPWLEKALCLLIEEAFSDAPGASTVAERAADILFVQAVRAHIASTPAEVSSGWLRGLLDPSIGRSLGLVHARPSEPWTVAHLARSVGLSRTVFAQRFRLLVGQTVMAYVTDQRMHVAARLLCASEDGLAQIAEQVGYETEVTFSKAFRAWSGEAPGRYRKRLQASTDRR
jgi:AraC-like DNA-binding protein